MIKSVVILGLNVVLWIILLPLVLAVVAIDFLSGEQP